MTVALSVLVPPRVMLALPGVETVVGALSVGKALGVSEQTRGSHRQQRHKPRCDTRCDAQDREPREMARAVTSISTLILLPKMGLVVQDSNVLKMVNSSAPAI